MNQWMAFGTKGTRAATAPDVLPSPDPPAPADPAASEPVEAVLARLVAVGALTAEALERGRRAGAGEATPSNGAPPAAARLDRVLTRLGLVEDRALVAAWSFVTGLPVADAKSFPDAPLLADLLVPAFLTTARCLPVAATDTTVLLAVEDPLDAFTPAAVAARTGRSVERQLARPADLDHAFERLGLTGDAAPGDAAGAGGIALQDDLARLRDLAGDAPVVRFVTALIDRAVELGASDIHLTATETGSRLRLRVDGLLVEQPAPPPGLHAGILSRVKIMAGLDIAERRLPQDGRIRTSARGRPIDLLVATMPHAVGEGVVLRILDRTAVALDFGVLGLSAHVVEPLTAALRLPHGMVLVTGPTGSGKTTTLYAALSGLRGAERNIVTVEDPVEYHLDGISQIQVSRTIGLDFARALRAVLRQDPDVIMVGEIRDRETAVVATQAALTGHLVIATVHTNTAAGALPRLADMGVEPFLLASTVRGAMAQRLVRRLCPHCRTPSETAALLLAGLMERQATAVAAARDARLRSTPSMIPDHERGQTGGDAALLAPSMITDHGPATCSAPHRPATGPVYEAAGCPACGGTGFRGRVAVGEYLAVSDAVRAGILAGRDEAALAALAKADGMTDLLADGLAKVAAGLTSVSEVLRVAGSGGEA
jgi:general secretion pathway protein E